MLAVRAILFRYWKNVKVSKKHRIIDLLYNGYYDYNLDQKKSMMDKILVHWS